MTCYSIIANGKGYLAVWPTKGPIYFARVDSSGELQSAGEIKMPGTTGMRTGMIALNGAVGYESVDLHGGRIAADLSQWRPVGDGMLGEFRVHDALEHLHDRIHTMKELHRCLASPRRTGCCRRPTTDCCGAFQDPTHASFWNSNSFWYYTLADQNRIIDFPVRFQANRLKNFVPSEWHRQQQIDQVRADLLMVAGRVPGDTAI